MGGIALVVLALLEGNSWGWMGLRTILSFLVGLLLIAVIVLRSKVHESPVIPLHLFSGKTFCSNDYHWFYLIIDVLWYVVGTPKLCQ